MSKVLDFDDIDISIVIHGGCFMSSYADLANVLLSYRKIFSKAEIIFSISSSDFIDFDNSNEERVLSHRKEMANFCYLVNKCADKIAYARMGHPLPPVFVGGNLCNVNNFIESAHNGLALATRKFVLRTRNDLLFKDRTFIESYKYLYKNYYREGKRTVFDLPVMISSLYTLNPFAGGRLPFHYGDWFHFGLLSDVRSIWDIPLITLDFMTYYKSHYCMPGTKEKERNFLSKIAVEQYIHFEFFRKKFKDIVLEFHNDDHSIDESIEILLDNFIVADLYKMNVYYPKYIDGFNSYSDNNTRIMQEAWTYLSSNPEIKPSDFLYVPNERLQRYTPKIFPLTVGTEHLLTHIGIKLGKSIAVPFDAPPGIACFGPYITLDKGKYHVRVVLSALYARRKVASLNMSVTYDKGDKYITHREYKFPRGNGIYNHSREYLELEFEVKEEKIDDFEVIIETFNQMDMAIDYIVINKI